MERLLADAQKLTGIKYDINNLSDVYEAIHTIQVNMDVSGYSADQLKDKLKNMSLNQNELNKVAIDMGISYEEAFKKMQSGTLSVRDAQVLLGTTAKESSETIQGSMASARASYQNFLSGQGGIEQVVTSFITAGKNIAKAFINLLPNLVEGIVGLINGLMPMIPGLIKAIIPALTKGVVELVNGLADILPELIEAILQGTIIIINALANALPTMIPAIVDAIIQIIPLLISYMPLFIRAGFQIIAALIEGILKSIPSLLASIPKIKNTIINSLSKIPGTVVSIGLDLVKGIGRGITSGLGWIKSQIKSFVGNVTSFIKKMFKVGSPSKLMSDQVGQWIPKGIAVGIDANTDSVYDSMKEMQDSISGNFGLSPQLANSLHYSPSVNVVNNVDVSTDPLGQTVNKIKTFSGGAKNDYNYGMGV